MGSHSSKADRRSEDSGSQGSQSHESGSRKKSKGSPDKGKAREVDAEVIVKDANLNVIDREPLDKKDIWGNMAKVVHSRHSSNV
jgi:hypothetical protein